MQQEQRIMVVCAHPDDETLGLGGTLALLAKGGSQVFVGIFAHGQFGRDTSVKGIRQRQGQLRKACSILGVKDVQFLNYDDQKLDVIPTVELSCKIEFMIKKWKPDSVYTHYWGDVNQDHRALFDATMVALRPAPLSKVNRFVCFETPSSTEWGYENFKPNLFVKLTEDALRKKIKAVKQYKGEILPYPHPRSIESIINRASYWGSSIGTKYAEAFLSFREIW